MARSTPDPLDLRLLLATYLLEGAGAVTLLEWYKHPDLLDRPAALPLIVTGGAATVAAFALGFLLVSYHRGNERARRGFLLALLLNLVVILPVLAIGELAVRLGARETDLGPTFAGTLLLPRDWPGFARRNREQLLHAPPHAFFVPDTLLGWSVGRNRSSPDSMYQSSEEGIRAAHAGFAYRSLAPAQWVAIVGDSYTFGMEGPYEDAWGSWLDRELAPGARVLNFGVDGYGVDQALLRYRRDVRPWRPAVVVFGFITHDLYRSLSVYTNLTFLGWGYPFSKPRFHLEGDSLVELNRPVVSGDSITRITRIRDLPLLEYEPGYNPDEWERRWYHRSWLVRYIVSRFPRYRSPGPAVDATVQRRLNVQLLLAFVREARADGAVPLVAFYPSRSTFEGTGGTEADSVLRDLRAAGVPALDLTSCIGALGVEVAFLPGRPHYSARGNAAVGACLEPEVKRALAGSQASAGAPLRARRTQATMASNR